MGTKNEPKLPSILVTFDDVVGVQLFNWEGVSVNKVERAWINVMRAIHLDQARRVHEQRVTDDLASKTLTEGDKDVAEA